MAMASNISIDMERRENIVKSANKKLSIKIDEIIEFLDLLTFLIFSNGHIIEMYIQKESILISTELIDSAIYSLNSIKCISKFGSISDMNVLLRKYRDDLFLYLYFMEVNNNYSILHKVNKNEEEHLLKWENNKLENLIVTDIFKYLNKNRDIKIMIKKYKLRGSWDNLGKKLNNFVHGNGIDFVKKNYREDINYENEYKEITNDLQEITLIFTTILILVKPSLISSTDYIDSLDMGEKPKEGSQYNVAPFIQDFIDKHLQDRFKDIKEFLKHTTYMEIK